MRKFYLIILSIAFAIAGNGQNHFSCLKYDEKSKLLVLSDSAGTISMGIKCGKGCEIDNLTIHNNRVVGNGNSIYTGFTQGTGSYTSANSSGNPQVNIAKNVVAIKNIRYGKSTFEIEESWTFTIL